MDTPPIEAVVGWTEALLVMPCEGLVRFAFLSQLDAPFVGAVVIAEQREERPLDPGKDTGDLCHLLLRAEIRQISPNDDQVGIGSLQQALQSLL